MDPVIKEITKVSIAGQKANHTTKINDLCSSIDQLPNTIHAVSYYDEFSTLVDAVSFFYRIFLRPRVRVRSLSIKRLRTRERRIKYVLSITIFRKFN